MNDILQNIQAHWPSIAVGTILGLGVNYLADCVSIKRVDRKLASYRPLPETYEEADNFMRQAQERINQMKYLTPRAKKHAEKGLIDLRLTVNDSLFETYDYFDEERGC